MNYSQLIPNVIFSINSVLPIFLIIAVGFILKKRNFFNKDFSIVSNNIVFTIALPAMIFNSIYNSDLRDVVDSRLILFCILTIIGYFLLITVGASILIKDRTVIGAFVQGSFRSNYILIGLPLIHSLYVNFNSEAIQKSTLIVSIIIPVFNILSIIILAMYSRNKQSVKISTNLRIIFTNPLIIAVFVAITVNLLDIRIPPFLLKTIAYFSSIAIPLALLDIGSSITISGISNILSYALTASILKIIVAPITLSAIAYVCNFRNSDLVILYILFASPTAVTSYIMAKNMDNSANLAASIVLFTTVGSLFTLFAGIFVLKTIGLM